MLTACKTVYVVPVIQDPIIEELPERSAFHDSGFKAVDENNFLISEGDLKIYLKYIVSLKNWGGNGWLSVQYYIDEMNRIKEEFKQ